MKKIIALLLSLVLLIGVVPFAAAFTVVPETYNIYDAAIKAFPAGGTVLRGSKVRLATSLSGVTLRYTTSGTTVNPNSTMYSAPITLSAANPILNVRAFRGTVPVTEVHTFSYTTIATNTPRISVSSEVGKQNDLINVDVRIDNNPKIASFDLQLDFDNTRLLPVSIASGAAIQDENGYDLGLLTSNLDSGSGATITNLEYITAFWHDDEEISANDTLFTVTFQIKTEPDSANAQAAEYSYANLADFAGLGLSPDSKAVYSYPDFESLGISAEALPAVYVYSGLAKTIRDDLATITSVTFGTSTFTKTTGTPDYTINQFTNINTLVNALNAHSSSLPAPDPDIVLYRYSVSGNDLIAKSNKPGQLGSQVTNQNDPPNAIVTTSAAQPAVTPTRQDNGTDSDTIEIEGEQFYFSNTPDLATRRFKTASDLVNCLNNVGSGIFNEYVFSTSTVGKRTTIIATAINAGKIGTSGPTGALGDALVFYATKSPIQVSAVETVTGKEADTIEIDDGTGSGGNRYVFKMVSSNPVYANNEFSNQIGLTLAMDGSLSATTEYDYSVRGNDIIATATQAGVIAGANGPDHVPSTAKVFINNPMAPGTLTIKSEEIKEGRDSGGKVPSTMTPLKLNIKSVTKANNAMVTNVGAANGAAYIVSFLYGDSDIGNSFESNDVLTLAQYLAEYPNLTFDKLAADVYYDGVIDGRDAVLMAQQLAAYEGIVFGMTATP